MSALLPPTSPSQPPADACAARGCACGSGRGVILAERSEALAGCGARLVPGRTVADVRRWLAAHRPRITPRAALQVGRAFGDATVARLAGLLVAGRLVALRGQPARPRMTVLDRPQQAVVPAFTELRGQKTSWIRVRVVHHLTGEAFEGVRLRLQTPDGRVGEYVTRADGAVEAHEIDPGSCSVACDLRDARLTQTLAFVALGDAAARTGAAGQGPNELVPKGEGDSAVAASAQGLSAAPPQSRRAWPWIAELQRRKVQTGDTLASIAAEAGLAWQDLALFNWGVREPDAVNAALYDFVGCTRRTPDGFNYVFTSDDVPGLLYIPRPWRVDGLATETTHTIRVRIAAGFRLVLENQDNLRIPEAEYEAKLGDGSVRKARLGRSGLALIEDPPPGLIEVVYPDLDDVEAKSLAACARRAMDDRDLREVFRVLKHSRELIHDVVAMYEKYYNDYTGGGLLADIEQEAVDPDDRLAIEALLRIADLRPEPGDGSRSSAPEEAV